MAVEKGLLQEVSRGLHHVRYADDFLVFVRSEEAANRVMRSVSDWIHRKLFLNVSAEKTKVVRPTQSKFLVFTFWRKKEGWKCKPHDDSKKKIRESLKAVLNRRTAVNVKLNELEWEIALKLRGWINYYRIGSMKGFLADLGKWLRHKVRVIILKKWKKRRTVFRKLMKLRSHVESYFKLAGMSWMKSFCLKIRPDEVFAQCFTRCGWHRLANNGEVNSILHPVVLNTQVIGVRYGLIDPLKYYLGEPELLVYDKMALNKGRGNA